MLAGGYDLDDITGWVEGAGINPDPVSGRQEYLENIVNKYV